MINKNSNEKCWKSSQLWPKRITWLVMGILIGVGIMFLSTTEEEGEEARLARATQELRKAGIRHIEIRRGLWGPMIYDPRMKSQQGRCYDSPQDAVKAALAGERPIKMEVTEK